jgi:hypothetical protein
MAHSRVVQALAGTLAELARLRIDFLFAQVIEQARRVQRRMAAAGFFMDQQLAEDGGPKVLVRHLRLLRGDAGNSQPEQQGGDTGVE